MPHAWIGWLPGCGPVYALSRTSIYSSSSGDVSRALLLPLLEGKAVLFQTDNITVASYINTQGGTHSTQLNQLAAHFGNGATPRGSPRQLSTYRVRKTWWQTFSRGAGSYRPSGHSTPMRLMQVFPFLQVDLFASSLNFQLPRYCSRSRDPGAWKVDAFSFHWGGIQGYAFRR